MAEVRISENESFEAALRRFNKKVQQAGILAESRRREAFENAAEKKKFAASAATLQDWLGNFELTPLKSRCEYGRLPHPQKSEEKKDYLDIHILHPVEQDKKGR